MNMVLGCDARMDARLHHPYLACDGVTKSHTNSARSSCRLTASQSSYLQRRL